MEKAAEKAAAEKAAQQQAAQQKAAAQAAAQQQAAQQKVAAQQAAASALQAATAGGDAAALQQALDAAQAAGGAPESTLPDAVMKLLTTSATSTRGASPACRRVAVHTARYARHRCDQGVCLFASTPSPPSLMAEPRT